MENDVKKCLGCDNSIDLTGKKNYCSNKCYRKNYSKEWYSKNKVVNSKTLKLCKCCGNSFLPKTKRSKYCSVKCSGKEWFREKTGFYNIKPRNCEYCEKLFIPNKGKNTKCCSGSCNSKLWAKNNKDKVKDNKDKNQKWSSLKRKYGLSKNDYLSLLLTQNYRCKICNNILDNGSKTHVDHDHETGKVRGILCSKCNVGLGNFKDSIQNLYNAIQYLQQNK
mgnify:FL=1